MDLIIAEQTDMPTDAELQAVRRLAEQAAEEYYAGNTVSFDDLLAELNNSLDDAE